MSDSSSPQKQPRVGVRHSHNDMTDFLRSGGRMSAYRMDRQTAPGWYEELEKLCQKLGVRTPAQYHVPTKRINGGMAMDAMVLTDGLIELTGSQVNHGKPSKEMLGVMAHELSHFKHDIGTMLTNHLVLPWAMPLAAMAGYYVYNRIKDQHRENVDLVTAMRTAGDSLTSDVNKAHEESNEDEQTKRVNQAWKASVIRAGEYVVIGALGFAGAALIARNRSRAAEFMADRTAVELTGDRDIFINILKKLHAQGKEKMMVEKAEKTAILKANPLSNAEKIEDWVKKEWDHFKGETFHHHPTLAEREQNLLKHFHPDGTPKTGQWLNKIKAEDITSATNIAQGRPPYS